MLVLTRKYMEKLYIGDDICVTVVRLEGGQVRLGIEAPREVPVVRAELLEPRSHAVETAASATATTTTTLGRGPEVTSRSAAAHGTDSRRLGRSR